MRRLVQLLVFVVIATTTTLAQAERAGQKKTEFFPLDQVKAGMRATGYTVFVGNEPKPFDLEILGVLHGYPNPKQSAVLSKLLGDELGHTGVFQGMSGSPVYINGKLLGAVAFGYQFAKDPIAGITPIQHMIDVFEQRQGTEQKVEAPRSVSFSEIAFTVTGGTSPGGSMRTPDVSRPARTSESRRSRARR